MTTEEEDEYAQERAKRLDLSSRTWNKDRLGYSDHTPKRVRADVDKWINETVGQSSPPGSSKKIKRSYRYKHRAQQLERDDFEAEGERRQVPYQWALWALCNKQQKFTPKQAQAIHLTYVEQITQREAADRLGITQTAYRDRLRAARKHLATVLRAEVRADGKRPSEVRRGRNRGR
jgi:hypothetical protein